MKVFVLYYNFSSYEPRRTIGVYSSRKLAEQEKTEEYITTDIEEYELDIGEPYL